MYLILFLLGGLLFVTIKYLSMNYANIKYASTIAAFPIGLLSSYIITDNRVQKYAKSYCLNILVLLVCSIIHYNLLNILSRNMALLLSIIIWMGLSIFLVEYKYIIH